MPPKFTAETPDQLISPDALLSMSGYAFLCAVRDGTISGPPIGAVCGFLIDEVEEGRVSFRGAPSFEHTNIVGGVHGGWYATILDSCLACAVTSLTPQGSYMTTLELKINITRAVPIGTEVIATGTIQHMGRSTGVASAELRDAKTGRLYATGSTTCMILNGT
ncbi:MAG: PaaI family thioesterase [Rhodovulum sp.]|jgi:uncharacterized protein (TIGR00369 family)|nr:thioesterase [Rhodovulum sp.]MCI5087122.1 PaaI family thioesterase [Rhodovulum sp.]|tara:strand:- start:177 stop:665 length:489 start_codon:yes stop_codon:yes gene_type:complete